MNAFFCWLCILIAVLISVQVSAQAPHRSHRMDRQLLFRYDNDLIFKTDRYYTSGLDLTYSRLVRQHSDAYQKLTNKRSDTLKVILQYHYGHKMFTPTGIRQRDVANFDRPYAGWHYMKFRLKNFSSVNSMNTFQIAVGLVGEASGVGNFQKWWHANFGMPQPGGWDYQIGNALVVNLAYKKMKRWRLIKLLDLITESAITLGNGANRLSQNITLRFGRLNRLFNSCYASSRLSTFMPKFDKYDSEEEEAFFFYGITGEHVISNIFIQGSLLRDNSLHTEEIEDFLITRKWGFMYSNYYTTFCFTVYRLTPEVEGGLGHRFLSLALAFRF